MIDTRSRDDDLLRMALIAAVVVHAGLLLMPWTFPRPPLPGEPERPPLVVTSANIPAPDIERPRVVASSAARRLPVPATVDVETLAEPLEEALDAPPEVEVRPGEEFVLAEPVPPPLPPVVHEGYPGLVVPERLPGAVPPEYPEIARRVKAAGVVVLQAVVDAEGRVTDIRVLRAPTPDLGFGEAAIRAVESWRYRAGEVGGRPVAVRLTVVVNFNLVR